MRPHRISCQDYTLGTVKPRLEKQSGYDARENQVYVLEKGDETLCATTVDQVMKITGVNKSVIDADIRFGLDEINGWTITFKEPTGNIERKYLVKRKGLSVKTWTAKKDDKIEIFHFRADILEFLGVKKTYLETRIKRGETIKGWLITAVDK